MYNILIAILFIIGFAARLLFLADLPKGIMQDEAFSIWQAWALLEYGLDVGGYENAVIIPYYGVGAAPFYYHFCEIFIAIFGIDIFAVRLPNAILGCLTLIIACFFAKKMVNEKFATLVLFLLAINPWHIMASRQALEITPAIFFMLLGSYLFSLGLEKPKLLILSAISYGLTFYCYMPFWVVVPPVVLLQMIYYRKISPAFIIAITLFGIPCVWFLLVNFGFLPEFRSPLISIPKLPSLRSHNFSLNIPENIYWLFYILLYGKHFSMTFRPTDVIPDFGLFYQFSLVFILIGFILIIRNMFLTKKRQELAFVTFPILGAIPYCLFHSGDILKPMIQQYIFLYIPLIFCCAYGIYEIIKNFNLQSKRILKISILTIYSIAFICFLNTYKTTKYVVYPDGWREVLERSIEETKIVNIFHIPDGIFLLGTMFPPKEFAEHQKSIIGKESNFLFIKEIGKYRFYHGKETFNVKEDEVYIFRYYNNEDLANEFIEHGFSVDLIGGFAYVYKNKEK